MRVAVQGFGNVGSYLARFLAEDGATVDRRLRLGGRRLQPERDRRRSRRSRTSRRPARSPGFDGAEAITNEELLLLDCDVLAPVRARAGDHGARTRTRSRRRSSCEGANGPTTPTADEILEDRGVLVLPDVLANAGGVVVSYFEWVQGLQEYFWKEDEVNARLNDIITRAFNETWATHESTEHDHADGGLRARRPAGLGGDDDPRPLSRNARRPLPRPRAATSARRRGVLVEAARDELASSSRRSTSAATRSSRRATASGCRSWRSTASGPSRTSSSRTRSAGSVAQARPGAGLCNSATQGTSRGWHNPCVVLQAVTAGSRSRSA